MMVVVLMALLVVASAGTGYFVGSTTNQTSRRSMTALTTITLTGGNFFECVNYGPTIGVALQVVANNGSGRPPIPVKGAQVSGQDVGYCNDVKQVIAIHPTTTNSSGWVSLLYGGFGIYYLNINYGPTLDYSLSVVTEPTAITYAVFNISTGNVTTHFCYYEVNCSRFSS